MNKVSKPKHSPEFAFTFLFIFSCFAIALGAFGTVIFLDLQEESHTQALAGDGGTNITEVILRNGVHCVAMDNRGGSKSIDCDWFGPCSNPTKRNPKGDGGTTITLLNLPSGHHCAVMDGRDGSAISCDFERRQS